MIQKPHDFKFAKGTQRKHFVLESFLHFLDGKDIASLLCQLVFDGQHDAIGAGADWFNRLEVIGQLEATAQNSVCLFARGDRLLDGALEFD